MSTGKTYSTKYLLDSNNNRGAAGQVLSTTSTGIDWVDANTVPGTGLWLANGNDIYNSNSGNVGIGTTTPDSKLEVDMTDASGNRVGFIGDGSTTGSALWTNWTTGASYLDFRLGGITSTYTKMRVTSTGRVGIGTTSPIYALDVVSTGDGLLSLTGGAKPTMRFRIGTSTVGTIQAQENTYMNVSAGGTSSLNLVTAGTTTRLTILTGGNVGIGTTTPAAKLDVYSAASFRADVATGNPLISIVNNTATSNTAGTATIKFTQGNTQAGGKIVSGRDGNYSSGATRTSNLQFYTSTAASDTEKMRITSDGKVGIGTTSPATQLEIYNNNDQPATLRLSSTVSDGDAVAAIISFSNDAGGGGVQGRIENIATEDDTTTFKFYNDNSSTPTLTLFDSGNMTITGTLTQNSDVRLKENIKPIESALDKVKQMQGVEFNKINSSTKEIGVVAQEIEKIIPELVLEDKEGIKSVAYGNITAVLIEAIKEQQKQIEKLKQQLNK